MEKFNPNDIGLPNGNFFALPYSVEDSEIILISVPWDVTTSYKPGTAKGPQAIIRASSQIDLFDVDMKNAWEIKIGTHDYNEAIASRSYDLRRLAEEIILHLEDGGNIDDRSVSRKLKIINDASESLNSWVYEQSKMYNEQNKIVGIVGGEHSVPFGLIKMLNEKNIEMGILHIDAHADLREKYEGFDYSHASIMHNVVTKCSNVEKLVQVGIRDFCSDEFNFIKTNKKIRAYTDNEIIDKLFSGGTWQSLCNEIVSQLPQKVYISFDIDGLNPYLCPNTGTPVPGGLSFEQAHYLLKTLAKSGKKIIGFDLSEVSPNIKNEEDEFDANVGARMLYKICCLTHLANGQR